MVEPELIEVIPNHRRLSPPADNTCETEYLAQQESSVS